jgi:hypothetical protein
MLMTVVRGSKEVEGAVALESLQIPERFWGRQFSFILLSKQTHGWALLLLFLGASVVVFRSTGCAVWAHSALGLGTDPIADAVPPFSPITAFLCPLSWPRAVAFVLTFKPCQAETDLTSFSLPYTLNFLKCPNMQSILTSAHWANPSGQH